MTEDRIERLEAKQNGAEKDRRAIELKVAKMGSDVSHIRSQIDNHLTVSIKGIFAKLDEMVPLVKDNTYWVGVFKKAVVWTAVTGVGGGLIALAFFLLKAFVNK